MKPVVRIALPDLVTNSYFAALAAVELGCFERRGITARHELIFPSQDAYQALADGRVEFVAAPAHSALQAFPEWRGVKLLAALSQGMYWKLVMRSDLAIAPGDLAALPGRRIGAAPMVELGLKLLLREAGIEGVQVVGVPGADAPGASFGVTAALALEAGKLDGFWANGMGAAAAVRSGVGSVVLDVRRGIGPVSARHYTMPVLATSDTVIARDPALVRAAVDCIIEVQDMLRADVRLAAEVGRRAFPPDDAAAITEVVADDLPFYHAAISPEAVDGLCRFARASGLMQGTASHEDVVAVQFQPGG